MYNINFPALTFSEPGVYYYTIKEHDTRGDEWTADRRVFRVAVTVARGGDGELTATAEYPDGFPTFINRRKRRCWIVCICRCCGRCRCRRCE